MHAVRRLALATAVTTYLLVVAGGVVRATESGLGCPDWPRCHGSFVPPLELHAWIEYSHRLLALLVVVLSAALAALALSRVRSRRDVMGPATAALPLVLVQAAVGAVVVALELDAESVVAHLALAMVLLAVVVTVAVRSGYDPDVAEADPEGRRLARTIAVVAGGVLGVMLLGSYVSGRGAGLAFDDWPLFDGGALPAGAGTLGFLHGLHRVAAAVVGAAMLWLFGRARSSAASTSRRLVTGAAALYAVQVLVGAANVWTGLSVATQAFHLAAAGAIWALLVAASSHVGREAPATVRAATLPLRTPAQRARAYLALTKPRVVELLLVTTIPAMVLAERGLPRPSLMAAVLVGGALAAGGANTINCYIDRDVDRAMRRTRRRPLPAGAVSPRAALAFGFTLEVVAFGWLWATANLLAAALAVAATVFYVFVYSLWLKPRTVQNIVIGGAAGAVPVLVGWAAVERGIGAPAWVLFAIVFVWTPPHFWALAIRYREDYAAAGVPMLPVVAGFDETARRILRYAVILVVATLVLQPVARLGPVYLVAALALGGTFVWHAARLRQDASPASAMRLFSFSNTYLALLFAAVAADVLLRAA